MKEDNEGHEYSQVQRGSQMEGRSAADDVGRRQEARSRGRAQPDGGERGAAPHLPAASTRRGMECPTGATIRCHLHQKASLSPSAVMAVLGLAALGTRQDSSVLLWEAVLRDVPPSPRWGGMGHSPSLSDVSLSLFPFCPHPLQQQDRGRLRAPVITVGNRNAPMTPRPTPCC